MFTEKNLEPENCGGLSSGSYDAWKCISIGVAHQYRFNGALVNGLFVGMVSLFKCLEMEASLQNFCCTFLTRKVVLKDSKKI